MHSVEFNFLHENLADRGLLWQLSFAESLEQSKFSQSDTRERCGQLNELDSNKAVAEVRLAKAREGDADALGLLLAEHRKYLVVLARTQIHNLLQGKADPSDIAQEVCLVAHERIGDFRGASPEEFTGWLRGILAKTLAMHVRKYLGTQKRDPRLEQSFNRGLTNASNHLQARLAGDATSPSQNFAKNEALLRLAEVVESLPADYRQVIILRHLEGLPFAEVAEFMDRSVNSVEKLWVRALAKLRTTIGEQFSP